MTQIMTIRRKFPIHPAHPERNCWGCDKYCATDSLACGNGSERTQHPIELFGEDWAHEGLDPFAGPPDFTDESDRDDQNGP
jgi:hypothetical protein